MICVQSSFIKDLDDIICDAHGSSNEFRRQIFHAKGQITDLVCKQIQRLKDRKDLLHSASRQSTNSSNYHQVDAFTDPLGFLTNETTQVDASTEPIIDDPLNINIRNDDTINNDSHEEVIKRQIDDTTNLRSRMVGGQEPSLTSQNNQPGNGWFQFSKRTKTIISALVVGFLVWLALIYGVLLGASMCSNGYFFLKSSRRPTVF